MQNRIFIGPHLNYEFAVNIQIKQLANLQIIEIPIELHESSLASQPHSVPQHRSLSVSAHRGRVWRLRTTFRGSLRGIWIEPMKLQST